METSWTSPLRESANHGKLRDGCAVLESSQKSPERYRCLRTSVAVSDCSYFGKFRIRGASALAAVNRLVLSDISRLPIRRMMSTLMLNPQGEVLADAYVVNEGDGYLLMTEGVPTIRVATLVEEPAAGAEVTDLTRDQALISVDGPYSWELLKEVVGVGVLGARYLDAMPSVLVGKEKVSLYRAGKTGEFGYLLMIQSDQARMFLKRLVDAGQKFGVGIASPDDVDVCKLENRVINVTREGGMATNVLELNCRIMVSRDKGDYLGKPAVEAALADGVRSRLIGLRCDLGEREGAKAFRPGTTVSYRGLDIGSVANATFSPSLNRWIAVAFLDVDYACVGLDYTVDGLATVRTVSAPFVQNLSLKVRPQEDSYFARS
jgi:glycine cleavage system aminomethyltransferase T